MAASCGEIPNTPNSLFSKRIDIEQIEEIRLEVRSYVQQMALLTSCIDKAVGALNIEATDYDIQFDEHIEAIEVTEKLRSAVVERFNFLMEHAGGL